MPRKIKRFLKLEYYRKRYGISQDDMAKLLGFGQQNYSRKEIGAVPFTLEECNDIVDILNKHRKKAKEEMLKIDDVFFD